MRAREKIIFSHGITGQDSSEGVLPRARKSMRFPSSLSDLKEIGCKFAWTIHISPLFWAIE
jgi:hypothetical protein